jgi:hypothetical protein
VLCAVLQPRYLLLCLGCWGMKNTHVVPKSMPMVVSGRASAVEQRAEIKIMAAAKMAALGSVSTLDFDFMM